MSEVAQHPYLNETRSLPTTMSTAPTSTQTAIQPDSTPSHFRGDRKQEVLRVAAELFRQSPDWVTFFREVMGVDGVVRRLFRSQEELIEFEKTEEYAELQQMVAKLRETNSVASDGKEPTRVITVRLPKSLHESLRVEAHDRKTSMNKLCISKLLQVIDDGLIPTE